ncbi:MAG: hypothetical protein LBT47_06350 [Deltaproteobacteria bacterium]|jgi:hypothetical protein|nr:hypothetical protein [Deltaproteobacteria bacterium]
MTDLKIISYFVLGSVFLVFLAALSPVTEAGAAEEPGGNRAMVGSVEVSLIGPEGLIKVDGQCPEADQFIELIKERFKLRVLAMYADPEQWQYFVDGLAVKEPRSIPPLAAIGVTTRMDGKSYDDKRAAKERRKLNNLVSLAINTRPLVSIFGNRANAKLREKLGLDLGFRYQGLGEFVGKFDENDRSVSYSVLASSNLYGQKNENFVTLTALRVSDKFIYLAWIDPDRTSEGISQTKTRTLNWVRQMNQENFSEGESYQDSDQEVGRDS